MNIVLIGYRGTGKSLVGALLGELLGMPCLSMDQEIVKRAGLPISEIVAGHGWPHFRDLESELARELSGRDNLVIDCGGGIIERDENVEALRKNSVVVWLKASVPTIVSRIQGDTERPALTAGKSFTEEVEEVLARRNPRYQAAADCEIETDLLTPEEIVERIVGLLPKAK